MSTLLWITYVAAVGLLASGAAYVIEPVLRALRWPSRPLWALALAAQLAAVAWALSAPDVGRPAAWLAIPWVLASATAFIVYLRALRTLRRERASWRVTIAEEMPVWVSERTGPAVVGFLRSIVVAPAWALALGDRERRLLLRHEAEHVVAWDPTLLLAGLATCALLPWSPAAWWALARLRLAIEVDCDRRVLTAEPDVVAYGELLVAVQGRVVPGAAGIAAFAERRLPLEERLEAMTARRPRGAAWRWSARGAVASALVVAACVAPRPTVHRAEPGTAMRTTGASAPAQPSRSMTITGGSMRIRYNPDGTQTLLTPHATITSDSGNTSIDMGPGARDAWVAESLKTWASFEAGRERSEEHQARLRHAVRAHLSRPGVVVADSVLVSLVLDPAYRVVAEVREPLRDRRILMSVMPEGMASRFPKLARFRAESSGGIAGANVGLPRTSAVRYWQLETPGRTGAGPLPVERENVFAALRTHFSRPGAAALTGRMIAYVVLDPGNHVVAEFREAPSRLPARLEVRSQDLRSRFPNLSKSLEVLGTGIVEGRAIGAAPDAVVLYWQLAAPTTSGLPQTNRSSAAWRTPPRVIRGEPAPR